MFRITIGLAEIEDIKSSLRETLPLLKSSHRAEAMARGLGFSTNAALRVAVRDRVEVQPNDSAFYNYVSEHATVANDAHLTRACAKVAIRAVMVRIPTLTHFGFGVFDSRRKAAKERQEEFVAGRAAMLTDAAQEEFLAAHEFATQLSSRKTINRGFTSYWLKHAAERYLRENGREGRIGHSYVSNGMMIAAAVFAGFEARESHPGSPNASFNISKQSLSRLRVERAAA